MAYFLGRDVDLYITTESKLNGGSSDTAPQAVGVVSNQVTLTHTGLTSGNCLPAMVNDASVLSGSISDTTGIDLSISTSDEDVGPFVGKPQIMQKVELRKETVVTITRKKSNNFWDVLYNGPTDAADFGGTGGVNDHRMGARFGVISDTTDNKYYINDGSTFMYNVVESGAATSCCYGYRVHLVVGNVPDGSANPGEIFTLRNAVMTGHTVTLNADGVTEETIEFTSSVAPITDTPTNTGAGSVPTGFDTAMTPIGEL